MVLQHWLFPLDNQEILIFRVNSSELTNASGHIFLRTYPAPELNYVINFLSLKLSMIHWLFLAISPYPNVLFCPGGTLWNTQCQSPLKMIISKLRCHINTRTFQLTGYWLIYQCLIEYCRYLSSQICFIHVNVEDRILIKKKGGGGLLVLVVSWFSSGGIYATWNIE